MKNRLILTVISLYLALAGVSLAKTDIASDYYSNLFEEISNIVEENFYNSDQIAEDFPDLKAAGRAQLAGVSTREAFSSLVNEMLRQLNASHTYYLTPEDYEYYQLCALFSTIPEIGNLFKGQEVLYPTVGILTQTIEEHVYIVSVLAGSIAEKAGLIKGDEILSANGRPFAPISSLRSYVGKNVTFEIRRKKREKPFTLVMQPILINPKKEMLAAQKASVRIIERSGKRIGYVHIYSYAGEEYQQELLNALVWGELKTADALIIDLRYGLGGASPVYLNIFNRNIPVLSMHDRYGRESGIDSQWRKPAVYLVNGFSRSGKEILAYGARKYHLATVIGERTAGQVLGGRLFPLSNGDALFLAVQSSLVDGEKIEGVGVAPDLEVPFDVRYCAGQDMQLEKALTHLAERLSNKTASIR